MAKFIQEQVRRSSHRRYTEDCEDEYSALPRLAPRAASELDDTSEEMIRNIEALLARLGSEAVATS